MWWSGPPTLAISGILGRVAQTFRHRPQANLVVMLCERPSGRLVACYSVAKEIPKPETCSMFRHRRFWKFIRLATRVAPWALALGAISFVPMLRFIHTDPNFVPPAWCFRSGALCVGPCRPSWLEALQELWPSCAGCKGWRPKQLSQSHPHTTLRRRALLGRVQGSSLHFVSRQRSSCDAQSGHRPERSRGFLLCAR